MTRLPILRSLLVTLFIATAAMPAMNVSAAIPCQELPVIEPPPDMVIPLIYIELPVTVEAALGRGMATDREGAIEAADGDTGSVVQAAENQFRCLGYGMDGVFAGNSTPQQRVSMWAVPAIEEDQQYIDLDTLYVVELGTPIQLEDGRMLIDFGIIVNGTQYLTGELVFVEQDGDLYLDGSAIAESVELNADPVVVELATRFTREVKIINVTNGDQVVFDNLEEEAMAEIVIVDVDGDTIFEGHAGGSTMVGGESRNIFVVHDLEPGEYQVTITFSPDDIQYGATLVVGEGGMATPVASPEASPQS